MANHKNIDYCWVACECRQYINIELVTYRTKKTNVFFCEYTLVQCCSIKIIVKYISADSVVNACAYRMDDKTNMEIGECKQKLTNP